MLVTAIIFGLFIVQTFAYTVIKVGDEVSSKAAQVAKTSLRKKSVSQQIRDKCDPQCAKYEESFNKLESFGESDDDNQMDIKDLRETFKGSCLYVQCLMQCGNPVTKLKCGKDAADLEKTTLIAGFSSVTEMLSSFNDTSVDFWPKECKSLGNA
uniref:Uncharacterized protein n=1 Tax=Romanomermis culicivorax TaxID=13658 RepID=A0A915IGN0_ROMCU